VRLDPRPVTRPLRRPHRPGRYLGGSAEFDRAIADFAETYTDQNDGDDTALQKRRLRHQFNKLEASLPPAP
jgi:hypothetical protein